MTLSAALAACTSGGSSNLTLGSFPYKAPASAPYNVPANAPYYIGPGLAKIDTDYLDRYACANGQPMRCERESRLRGSTAYCRCPF